MESDSEDDDFIPQFENESSSDQKSNKKDSKRKRDKKLLTLDEENVIKKSTKIQKTDESSNSTGESIEQSTPSKEEEIIENEMEDNSNILAMFSKGVKAKKTQPTKKLALPKAWLDNDDCDVHISKQTTVENKELSDTTQEKKLTSPVTEAMKETKYTYMGEEVIIKEPESNTKVKPISNLSAVLNEMKGKNKLSSLQKSKYDWNQYTSEENIEIELEQNKKNGYLQKLSFLQQTDLKQFELEKEVRNKARRRT